MDIAPAVNSARPASITYLALGANPAKLAVNAKGTVMPSEVPMTASSMVRADGWKFTSQDLDR